MKWKPSDVRWTPFVKGYIPESQDLCPVELRPKDILLNNRYQVAIWFHGECDPKITHLSIKRRDKEPIRDWRDLQRIKNEICGPECEAVEIFPAESRLVDTANQYHLWVFPAGFRFPFGFEERLVSEVSNIGGKQRRFSGDVRPDDLTNLDKEEVERRLRR